MKILHHGNSQDKDDIAEGAADPVVMEGAPKVINELIVEFTKSLSGKSLTYHGACHILTQVRKALHNLPI